MTAQTLTLTQFLLDRLSEDEAGARAASEDFVGWMNLPDNEDPVGVHIQAWIPARVLAECAAKRQIVELHHDRTPPDMVAEYIEDCEPWTPECAECSCYGDCRVELPCPTLRALASVYADHADYDERWAL